MSDQRFKKMEQEIANVCKTDLEASGIAFIIGMGDAVGADEDGENIVSVLRDLNFVVFRKVNSSREDLSCLIKTVALGKCPIACKNIIFYYAGHGGIDHHGNSYMQVVDGNEGKFYIDANMIAHFNRNKVKKKQQCLFFFDCCLSDQLLDCDYIPSLPVVPIRCLVAFATTMGFKSYGDCYTGGMWTKHLCAHLKEQRSVSDILDIVHTEVGDEQPSVYSTCAGAVFLNGKNINTLNKIIIIHVVILMIRSS